MKEKIVEQRILTADEGKILTNGEAYGKTVVLPASVDSSLWYEITEEEHEKRIADQVSLYETLAPEHDKT